MENISNELTKGILPYAFVVFSLAIIITIFYNKIIGKAGEFWTRQTLRKLPKDKYYILNDIMLKDDNGTHQIDTIVISEYAIFVIEVKNYAGLIIGNEYDQKWVQYLGKRKYYFNNPIHQNYGHIKTLEKLLNLTEKDFVSIICFSNRSKLNIKSKTIVTKVDLVSNEILKFTTSKNFNIITIKETILSKNILDKKVRKEHVENIKKNKDNN